jgi:rhodanese-related sulfurtransferase
MIRSPRSFAVVLLLLACALPTAAITPVEGEKFSYVSLREALELHGKAGVFFIDVNEPEIYERYHVPGATLVTSEHLEQFLPADKQAALIFYCAERRCLMSHAAAHEAVKLGYTQVRVMPEGIFGWVNAGLPISKGAAK